MKSFKDYITEDIIETTFKKYLNVVVKGEGIKLTASSRHGVHIRFPLQDSDIIPFFKRHNIKAEVSDRQLSKSYDTYVLTLLTGINDVLVKGSTLFYVNNTLSVSGSKTLKTKQLTPDAIGVAGKELSAGQIKTIIDDFLNSDSHMPDNTKFFLKELTDTVYNGGKGKSIDISDIKYELGKADLATVSKDFGELLVSMWIIKNLGFRKAFFPVASNEPLVDLYGMRLGIPYPISVKSGGGSKVAIKNILNSVKKKLNDPMFADHLNKTELKAVDILKTLADKPAHDGIITGHKILKSKGIKTLSKITGIPVSALSKETIKGWVATKDKDELKELLQPFYKDLKSKPGDKMWKQSSDKARFVIGPLGESLWKMLNQETWITDTLSKLANMIIIIQVNVDVKAGKIIFGTHKFKTAKFKFGWPGYSSGNKLGFTMSLK